MKDTAIFLCNRTLNAAQPWIDAGYNVVFIDPQHPEGVHTEGQVTRIGHILTDSPALAYVGALIRANRVAFVAGFPPCTDVALSGTRWWEAKFKKDRYFQAKAAIVAEQCRMIGELSGAPWFFENPMSAFSRIFGRPQHKFHPHQFTSLCPDDNYTKETWLWTGGGSPCRRHALTRRWGRPMTAYTSARLATTAPTSAAQRRAASRSRCSMRTARTSSHV